MRSRLDRIEQKFSALLRDVDAAVRPLVECIDVEAISRHNALYKRYGADKFKFFVKAERRRYIKALDIITSHRSDGIVCDLGGFVPYLPVALSMVGYSVKIVDKYEVYGPVFKSAIERLAQQHGIQVFHLDILNDSFQALGQNDVVLLMAVVEHLNGSPRHLMRKIQDVIAPDGFLLFEVPNIAGLIKRVRLLLGHAPMADYEDYFYSGYPHMGHNREMTVSEVRYMFEHSGYDADFIECYDYDDVSVKWRGRLALKLAGLLPVKSFGQSIMAKARPRSHMRLERAQSPVDGARVSADPNAAGVPTGR